jgi:hypothetical protein
MKITPQINRIFKYVMLEVNCGAEDSILTVVWHRYQTLCRFWGQPGGQEVRQFNLPSACAGSNYVYIFDYKIITFFPEAFKGYVYNPTLIIFSPFKYFLFFFKAGLIKIFCKDFNFGKDFGGPFQVYVHEAWVSLEIFLWGSDKVSKSVNNCPCWSDQRGAASGACLPRIWPETFGEGDDYMFDRRFYILN